MMDFKVSLGLALLGGLGLAEGLMFAQVLAHFLLNQLDSDDQVHTKVDKSPLDTLSLVLLLLLDKHVVVEELLETLVGVVDKKLLQNIELEDFKAGNIQDTDEIFPGVRRVQGVVDPM